MRETGQDPNIETEEKTNIQQFNESAGGYKERFNALCAAFNIEQLLQEISQENSPDAEKAKIALDQAAKEFLNTMTTVTIKEGELQGSARMAADPLRESFTKAKAILESTGSADAYTSQIETVETALSNSGA